MSASNGKIQTLSSRVMTKTRFEISVIENELVRIKVGNIEIDVDHNCALWLSQQLRLHGKRAKRQAGDYSTTIGVSGILTDAENDYKHGWNKR